MSLSVEQKVGIGLIIISIILFAVFSAKDDVNEGWWALTAALFCAGGFLFITSSKGIT